MRDASYGTATLEPFAASLGAAATNGAAHDQRSLRQAQGDTGGQGDGTTSEDDATMRVEVNGKLFRVRFVDLPVASGTRARGGAAPAAAKTMPKKGGSSRTSAAAAGNDVIAPMHGVVVEIPVAQGASVNDGDVVAVIEAMKMMNEIRAHKAGTVATVHVAAGTTVEARTPLVTLA